MIRTFSLLFAASLVLLRLLSQGTADRIKAIDLATDPNLMAVIGAHNVPLIYIKSPGYLNRWAVIINSGEEGSADEIASQYGFTNRGQVSQ